MKGDRSAMHLCNGTVVEAPIDDIGKMKNSHFWFGLILFWVAIGRCSGKEDVNRFELESKEVRCRYEIEVVVPSDSPSPGIKYPVVYCMDWFILGDYLKSLPKMMELGRLTEPYILVGITEGQNSEDWAAMRTRDFTPAQPTDEYSKKNMFSRALEMTGGAKKFATFLKKELIPIIESKYPGDPGRRCFLGYSLGGLLGVYILKTDPNLFQYYLLGSPSLWFNDYSLASELMEIPADHLKGIKKVYLSVGEKESWEMLKGFGMLRTTMLEKGLVAEKVKTEIINASGHVGAMPIAIYNGLRFLFDGK